MGDSRSWAAEREEEEFWASIEGKLLKARIEESNEHLEEWNKLVNEAQTLQVALLTVEELKFLLGVHQRSKVQALSCEAYPKDHLIDDEELSRLRRLVVRG